MRASLLTLVALARMRALTGANAMHPCKPKTRDAGKLHT
jgi:hypothetical protein